MSNDATLIDLKKISIVKNYLDVLSQSDYRGIKKKRFKRDELFISNCNKIGNGL